MVTASKHQSEGTALPLKQKERPERPSPNWKECELWLCSLHNVYQIPAGECDHFSTKYPLVVMQMTHLKSLQGRVIHIWLT